MARNIEDLNPKLLKGIKWRKISLDLLYLNPDNINEMDSRITSRLATSLSDEDGFGMVQNFIVMPSRKHKGKFMVLAGNHRLEVLRGADDTPEKGMCCVVPWMPKARRMLLAQALNRIHGSDNRDDARDLYQRLLGDVGAGVMDSILGHQTMTQQLLVDADKASRKIVEDLNESEDDEEGEDREIEHIEPKPNFVYFGDCRDFYFPNKHFDCIVTDPPYKIGIFEKKWDSGEDVYNFTLDWLPRMLSSVKPGGYICIFINSRQYDQVVSAMRECKLIIRDPLAWIRYIAKIPGKRLNDAGTVYTTLKNCLELVAIGQKKPAGTYRKNFKRYGTGGFFFENAILPYVDEEDRQKAIKLGENILALARSGRLKGRGYRALQGNTKGWIQLEGRRPSNVVVLPEDKTIMPLNYRRFFVIPTIRSGSSESEGHETQKPLELVKWLVRLVTPPHGWLLDPFCGSGTMIEAAITTERTGTGVEISRKTQKKCMERVRRCLPQKLSRRERSGRRR